MHHGQEHPSVKPKPVTKSLEQAHRSSKPKVPKLEKTTTLISLQNSSSTNSSMASWNHPPISLKRNDWTNQNPSSPKKTPKPSFQVFFWETLMTVILLIMALWMQSLPTRQLPQTIKNNPWPTLEMSNPQIGF